MATKSNRSQKSNLKSSFSFLPSSRNNRILLSLILVVGASVAGLLIYRSFALTPPRAEGYNGCLYDYFEGRTNSYRSSRGLVRLTPVGSLEDHACALAKRVAKRGTPFTAADHDFRSWCNYACGQITNQNTSGDTVFNGWLGSPTHLNLIRNSTWRNQGCAHVRAPLKTNGRTYIWAVCNYQHF